MTVKKDEESAVYFLTVKKYFEMPTCSGNIRLEALGSAVANAVAVMSRYTAVYKTNLRVEEYNTPPLSASVQQQRRLD